ncbi:type II CRISPR-associated endonuclease Cas1 [Ralstonia pseudosolanacearum]|uniref:type II CRISPR-associated endonuclease Cas1 n=1 Tax=Ralstonia pseudosolanacearum TaxID=1310165 RepID=UPI0018D0732F|nr:type II CRISPR-associated endonuclease Cas1 [Ralstonia pseudosolanacearum]
MIGRIVEIATDNRYLGLDRGFMVVKSAGEEVGRVPLDDLAAVIIAAHGVTHSSNLLVALAERGVPFVLTAANMQPVGMLWSVDGNYQQAGRMEAQLGASLPQNKRLWQQVVRSKLQMQAVVLESMGAPSAPLSALVPKVRSGDPENYEAQGARRYWVLLFGDTFRRDRQQEGINTLLNYGYTVLRAATARAVIAAGLHPSVGLHHSNTQNAMRLVDDLMEPFRPLIDLQVHACWRAGNTALDRETKKRLADVMYLDMPSPQGITPVMGAVQRLCTSLAQLYLGERKELELPLCPTPIDLAAMFVPLA